MRDLIEVVGVGVFEQNGSDWEFEGAWDEFDFLRVVFTGNVSKSQLDSLISAKLEEFKDCYRELKNSACELVFSSFVDCHPDPSRAAISQDEVSDGFFPTYLGFRAEGLFEIGFLFDWEEDHSFTVKVKIPSVFDLEVDG